MISSDRRGETERPASRHLSVHTTVSDGDAQQPRKGTDGERLPRAHANNRNTRLSLTLSGQTPRKSDEDIRDCPHPGKRLFIPPSRLAGLSRAAAAFSEMRGHGGLSCIYGRRASQCLTMGECQKEGTTEPDETDNRLPGFERSNAIHKRPVALSRVCAQRHGGSRMRDKTFPWEARRLCCTRMFTS